jgi:peptidoglycan lytic transglycosylase A
MKYFIISAVLIVFLASCMAPPVPEPPIIEPIPEPVPPVVKAEPLQSVEWDQIDGWLDDDLTSAFSAFVRGCEAIGKRDRWQSVCDLSNNLKVTENRSLRDFFESNFQPYQVQNEDGSTAGLITGYYGPELLGSRTRTETYRYPLYRQPDDLLIIDLDEVYPELGQYRLRGRVVGNRVVPYFERSEIDNGVEPLQGEELFWVADPVELFFLHIQGSGLVSLTNGDKVMVNYANQNGHPYRSIGKILLDRKAMTRHQMSMQNIRRWVEQNPEAGKQLLAENPSYVFFRELPDDYQSPPGALGVPLTERRSLAVDPRTIPLGAPVFISTTFPGTGEPLQQLMVAQDTGGAIKGQVRADFFWGMGNDAGKIAGRMKQDGFLWVLLPKEMDELKIQSSSVINVEKDGEVN